MQRIFSYKIVYNKKNTKNIKIYKKGYNYTMYGITIDILIIVLILLFAIVGTFRGFFKSLTALMGLGLAVLLTYLLREQILALDNSIGIASSISNTLGEGASKIITLLIYGAIIFVLLKILALILNATLGKIFNSKFLGGINKFFGFLFGFAKGLLISFVLLFILTGVMQIPSVNDYLRPKLADSFITLPIVDYLEENILEPLTADTSPAENPVLWKISTLMAGLLVANARRGRLKFFSIPTKRKLRLRWEFGRYSRAK